MISFFCLFSTMDQGWKEGMSSEELQDLVCACMMELRKRFIIHQPKFQVVEITSDGITDISDKITEKYGKLDVKFL